MKQNRLFSLSGILFLLVLSACNSAPQRPLAQSDAPWQYADLRALAFSPENLLIAAYARTTTTDLEIRFDLLDPTATAAARLILAIDAQEGGSSLHFAPESGEDWDLLVDISPGRSPQITGLVETLPAGARIRAVRSPVGALVMRIQRRLLPGYPEPTAHTHYRMIAFLASDRNPSPSESFGPIRLDAPPPPPAPLLLSFWDTLPSATPAQALRRWDGAHTGPYGQRHGLRILLDAARRQEVPLALLDLKNPEQLVALEALGGLDMVQAMQHAGLILLPDILQKDQAQVGSNDTRKLYSLKVSSFLYASSPALPLARYSAAFAHLEGTPNIRLWRQTRLVPLPEPLPGDQPEINEQGLSIPVRAQLLQVALSPDPGDLVVLGGSLPRSPWGDLLVAGPAFEDIASHPWILPLDEEALLTLPAVSGEPACPDLLCQQPDSPPPSDLLTLEQKLSQAPENVFSQLGAHTYRALTGYDSNPLLRNLRAGYLGNVEYLLRAAQWAQAPGELGICDTDLDGDESPECLLASERHFLILSTSGGRLVFAAAQTPTGVVQWAGTRSQLVTGLSDPRDWKIDQGWAADPQEIPGAFADIPDAFLPYTAVVQPGEIILTRAMDGQTKRFRLESNSVAVTIENAQPPLETQLPLILLDDQAFRPGWLARYQTRTGQDFAAWGMKNGACVQVHTVNANLLLISFLESQSLLAKPEDPNLHYSAGHYLPFPMALIQIQAKSRFTLNLSVTPFQENFAGLALGRSCIEQP